MMTGDQLDMYARLKSWMPSTWFTDNNPTLDALLNGLASTGSFIYSQYAYAIQQSRINTATGDTLDAVAKDFFGVNVVRGVNQSDASFRADISIGLFRERTTRGAVVNALLSLTGQAPMVFEPASAADSGAYNAGTLAYDVGGGYGDLTLNNQAFVTAYRPAGSGTPMVGGYDSPVGGYDSPSLLEYASISMGQAAISDAQILSAINAVRPIGMKVWVQILNRPNRVGYLDINFTLDSSVLGSKASALDSSFVLDSSVLQ